MGLVDALNYTKHLYVVMPPTLKKWGTYWFRLVRMYVCMYVCMYVFMFEISS